MVRVLSPKSAAVNSGTRNERIMPPAYYTTVIPLVLKCLLLVGATSGPGEGAVECQRGRRSHEARLLRLQELGCSVEPHARYDLNNR